MSSSWCNRRGSSLSLFMALAAVAAPRAAAAMPQVEVSGERVSLGDLVGGLEPGLATFDLGPAPQPGQSRTLSRAAVTRRLRQAMLDVGDFSMPAAVSVRRASQVVSAVELRRRVLAAVALVLPDGLKAREVTLTTGLVLPAGTLSYAVTPAQAWQVGRQLARVEITTPSGEARTVLVTADIEGVKRAHSMVVLRGAEVQIVARTAGILVRAPAVAQQNGELGEVIAVLPNGSNKLVKARVADARTVEVDL